MNQEIKHPLLASPAFIGNLELKNRMIMAAMGSNFASEKMGMHQNNLQLTMRKGPGVELD